MSDGRANNGGKREGAGRPKLEATVLREVLMAKLQENAGPIAEALIKKGLDGDVPALRELLDRGLGKPAQAIDHTTKGKELTVNVVQFGAAKTDESKDAD